MTSEEASPDQSALISGLAAAILASDADAIIATDRLGIIRYWNPGAARIFGFAASAALGASLDLIIPERLRNRHWAGYRRVIESGTTRYGSADMLAVPAQTADGRQISVEFTIVMLADAENRIIGMAATLRDVTARFAKMQDLKRQLDDLRHKRTDAGSA